MLPSKYTEMINQLTGENELYHIFGKEYVIHTMGNPEGGHGSIFEVNGSESLQEIGLAKKFYFQAPDKFSLGLPSNAWSIIYGEANNHEQQILSIFLLRSIEQRRLVEQYYIGD